MTQGTLQKIGVVGVDADIVGKLECMHQVDIDVAAIPLLLDTPARYIGVMGSARRWATVRDRLLEADMTPADLERIHVPIGIELGAETVEEIAVSILSEIIRTTRTAEADRS